MEDAKLAICGLGSYLPEQTLEVDEIARQARADPRRLHELGYATVHLAGEGEMPTDMAVEASRRALADAGLQAGDIDVIIYSGAHKDHIRWQASNKVQALLQAFDSYVFDVDQSGAGPALALKLAADLLGDDPYIDTVLVCAAESWDTTLPGRLLGRSFVVGDGAAAALLCRGGEGLRLRGWRQASWGRYHRALCVPEVGAVRPITGEVLARGGHLFQVFRPGWEDGQQRQELIDEFNRRAAATLEGAVRRAGAALGDLAFLVLPNLPRRHGLTLCRQLGIDPSRTSLSMAAAGGLQGGPELLGNLLRARREGMLAPGGLVGLLGLGAGYHWSALVLEG
ncbi:MAG: hypothetical protein DRI34_10050 [Deltaproteobacteria bacterium]|nr:MAG: hypothetical protein DRI34_10050 [Deltaproteobacteria bacterium]